MTNKFGVVALLLAAACFGCAKASAPGKDVAARVNGTDILRSEVEKYFTFKTQQSQEKAPVGEEAQLAKLEIVRDLIEREMMSQKAAALKLAVKDSDVEEQLKQLRGPASPDDFKKELAKRGFSEDDMRKEIRRTLTAQILMRDQVASKIQIADSEVSRFYDENKQSFNVPETQYHIGQIVVTADPSGQVTNLRNDKALNAEQAVAKVQRIAGLLKSGQDFTEVAREFSEDPQTARQGGDLGFQGVSSLDRIPPQIKQAILKMSVGEVAPVQTPAAFWILKLFAKREPGQRTLQDADVKESIHQELQTRRQQLLAAAFSEQMHNQSHVENFLAEEVLAGAKSGK